MSSPEYMTIIGPMLEERGFEAAWVAEHVVTFDDYDSHHTHRSSSAARDAALRRAAGLRLLQTADDLAARVI